MTEFTVTTTTTVTTEQVASLITSALSGGSNRWIVSVETIEPEKWEWTDTLANDVLSLDDERWDHEYPLNPGGAIVFHVYDPDVDASVRTCRLDLESIQLGLSVMAAKHPAHFSAILKGCADEITGDVFLQHALFGEIIYS